MSIKGSKKVGKPRLEMQGGKHMVNKGGHIKRKRSRSRRTLLEGSRRPVNKIQRKVRRLKKLIPKSTDQSMGLDGLFRETAEYILALQIRVKAMHVMINLLSGSDE